MSGVRCFVGIPLPTGIAGPVLAACDALRDADRTWREEKWVAPENLHVTVKFLGTVDEGEVAPLFEAIGAVVETLDAFTLPFHGLTARPNARRCRMLWASFLDPEGAGALLAEAVDEAALAFGIPPEERSYQPHATLCRARRPKPVSEAGLGAAADALEGVPELMSVPSASLFSSRLTPRGPIYTEVGAWQLRGE